MRRSSSFSLSASFSLASARSRCVSISSAFIDVSRASIWLKAAPSREISSVPRVSARTRKSPSSARRMMPVSLRSGRLKKKCRASPVASASSTPNTSVAPMAPWNTAES